MWDIIESSADFPHFYVQAANGSSPWVTDFFIWPPENQPWINVQAAGITKQEFLQQALMINIMTEEARSRPSDSALRWKQANLLWSRLGSSVINNINIKREFQRVLLERSLAEGIQYLETRKNPRNLYELDTSEEYRPTFGKKYLDDATDGELDVNLTMDIEREFIATNPSFIGHRRIMSSSRWSTLESMTLFVEKGKRFAP